MKGNVFDIQRYSIHDGRGIRTVVFLKGCPLRCKWCSNPESQQPMPSLFYSEANCIHCHTCVHACPDGEITVGPDGGLVIDWEKCRNGDLSWVDQCPTNALRVKGGWMTPEDVVREVRKDMPFYGADGGVTFSGGEPLLQGQFVAETAAMCRAEGITTAVETTGCVSWEILDLVRPHIGQFLYDLKAMDPELHRKWVGADNRLILENLKRLAACGADIMVRTPLIPGVNDREEEIDAILRYVKECGVRKYDVLPFHQYGSAKYQASGMPYSLGELQPPPAEQVERIREKIRAAGLSMEF